jgi:hypothetical protein
MESKMEFVGNERKHKRVDEESNRRRASRIAEGANDAAKNTVSHLVNSGVRNYKKRKGEQKNVKQLSVHFYL